MEDWMGIYKGLRLPLLGIVMILMCWYLFRPGRDRKLEDIRFRMLEDDMPGEAGGKGENHV